jgi:hypothetical protein
MRTGVSSQDQELPSDNDPFLPVVDVLINDRIVDHRLSCLPQSRGKPDPNPIRLARLWGYSLSSRLNRCEIGMNGRAGRPELLQGTANGNHLLSMMLDGSTQTPPPAQTPNSLAYLWSSAQELVENLQSSFENSDLTLFAFIRMLRVRKLRGLLCEDSGPGSLYFLITIVNLFFEAA